MQIYRSSHGIRRPQKVEKWRTIELGQILPTVIPIRTNPTSPTVDGWNPAPPGMYETL